MKSVIKLLLLIALLQTGCKKLVDPSAPGNKIGVSAVYANNKTASSVLSRLFADFGSFSEGSYGVPILMSVAGDDLNGAAASDAFTQDMYSNRIMRDATYWWYDMYKYIYTTNDALEMLPLSKGVTDPVRNQLMGEARFARAFCYFYLVNIYGDVPLITSTDYRENIGKGRTATAEIYQLIVNDLVEAKALLSDKYFNADITTVSTERLRPTKAVATAMLARVYLYLKEYAKAEAEASEVIANPIYELPELNSVFLRSSKEAIWQLPALVARFNTQDGKYLILRTTPGVPNGPKPDYPFVLTPFLKNAFETGDTRSTKWVGDSSGFKFANKYKVWDIDKPVTEYVMMLRLAEQYLIRGEARIKQNKVGEGIDDLNALRKRARGTNPGDLPDLSKTMSQDAAIQAVEHERQVELFVEWGHRWFDLKRTDRLNAVMTVVTPLKNPAVTWQPFRALCPLPTGEVTTAPGLIGHQNPGYNN
ncbi:RagB/SusD family nutrient uptake outer membrane protein [Chitinophaga niabensis]|uniref:RagB/SusD family nutrient uptake outer membrane protein n=1 Tax=Chitinophaga niabensis TaxID=536979 RepID=UPI0031BA4B1F